MLGFHGFTSSVLSRSEPSRAAFLRIFNFDTQTLVESCRNHVGQPQMFFSLALLASVSLFMLQLFRSTWAAHGNVQAWWLHQQLPAGAATSPQTNQQKNLQQLLQRQLLTWPWLKDPSPKQISEKNTITRSPAVWDHASATWPFRPFWQAPVAEWGTLLDIYII
jgi:hypothetical protein